VKLSNARPHILTSSISQHDVTVDCLCDTAT